MTTTCTYTIKSNDEGRWAVIEHQAGHRDLVYIVADNEFDAERCARELNKYNAEYWAAKK